MTLYESLHRENIIKTSHGMFQVSKVYMLKLKHAQTKRLQRKKVCYSLEEKKKKENQKNSS